ncbi:methyltransferase domain-containing protein [Candidatus Woesearchaeota archaeon]|nr:methyltransferase domain-containing protein [Candidatus Woesearchaeota archaeon]
MLQSTVIPKSKEQLVQRNKQFFTAISKSYDTRLFSYWLYSMQKHAIKQILRNKKATSSSLKILDIGCGTGQLLSHLVKELPHAELYGIDLTEAMVSLAKQKLKQHKNIMVQQTSVEKMPFKDKLFDYVLTTEAFHHFPEPEKALLEMKRVLKDDGKIILIDINFGPGISYIFHKLEPGNKNIYSKKQFQELFKATGLQLIEQKRIGVVAIYNLLEK